MAGNKVYVQGSYVDVHDNEVVNLSIDKAGTVQVQGASTIAAANGEHAERVMPECLQTERAQGLLQKAQAAGWLDERWQPTLSATEAALLAMRLAECLEIRTVWKVFGQLWQRNSESLRAKYNVAMEQEKSLEFQGLLKRMLK